MTVLTDFIRTTRARVAMGVSTIAIPAVARQRVIVATLLLAACTSASGIEPTSTFQWTQAAGQLELQKRGKPLATYIFHDPQIARPYWKHLHSSQGRLLSRDFPPHAADDHDHANMHPGLWLAFGDLNGHDFWRNRARVEHVRFVTEPTVDSETGIAVATFAVENRYAAGEQEIAREEAVYRWQAHPLGVLLNWHSTIRPTARPLELGHQEEMGLGVRVASWLRVKSGQGTIRNSAGGTNEAGTWGQHATWWSYADESSDRIAGWLIVVLPTTSQPVWGHTRDYGLLVLNPSPPPTEPAKRTRLADRESLVLNFAILLFDLPAEAKLDFEQWARQVAGPLQTNSSTN
jgi:hypothetical protein